MQVSQQVLDKSIGNSLLCTVHMKKQPPKLNLPLTDSRRDTRFRVRQLSEAGHTPREIALLLHISTQRVYQHRKKIALEEAADKAGAA